MTHAQPAFDGSTFEAPAPAITRRVVDDYEAWVDEVWQSYVAAADTGLPFTIDSVARKNKLPDPPRPKSMWGSLPIRLQNAGVVRHHGAATSARAGHSMVHQWIGVPAWQRETVARRRREDRAAAREQRASERRAAA